MNELNAVINQENVGFSGMMKVVENKCDELQGELNNEVKSHEALSLHFSSRMQVLTTRNEDLTTRNNDLETKKSTV